MSNIGKKPVHIEEGVTVVVSGSVLTVSGPKGTLETKIPRGVDVAIQDGIAFVKRTTTDRNAEKFVGLVRALLANMVHGVAFGFEKKLELSGVGYRARVEGNDLILNIGFANPVKVGAPLGIKFQVDEGVITVSGNDKQLVGDVADTVRKVRPPDPYKAKGIKYEGEYIRRKAGKAAKTIGAK